MRCLTLPSFPPACPAGDDALCNKLLYFAAIGLGCVLPVLLSAFRAARGACQNRQRVDGAGEPAAPQSARGLLRPLRRAAAAVRAADRGISRALGARPFRLQRPLLIWWALGYSWELSKALARLPAVQQQRQ